jgi:hypothetical protein
MSTLGDATDVNFWQIPRHNAFLFPVHVMFPHDFPLGVKPASTPWHLIIIIIIIIINKKNNL